MRVTAVFVLCLALFGDIPSVEAQMDGGVAIPRIPNLLCRADSAVFVQGRSLKAERATSQTLYTIRNDSLFIADPGEPEFHYNNLLLPQPFRATTYFLTITFIDRAFEGRAVVVRALMGGDVSVVQVRCTPSAPSR
jgi:hypothetical protein